MFGKQFFNKRIAQVLLLMPCLAIWSQSGAAAQDLVTEYSNRISIMQDTLLAGFESPDLDGFTAETRLTLSQDNAAVFHIRPHQGSSVLYVAPEEGIPANEWRTVSKVFAVPEDLSSVPVAQLAVFTQQGPDMNQYLRMRIYGRNSYAEGTAKIIPGLWRNVMFDFTGTKAVDRVEKIEISLMCDSGELWNQGRDFVLDGLRFGKPMDLAFMIPGSEEVFALSEGKVGWKNDALIYRFRKGESLVSCDLGGSRNRSYSPPLGNSPSDFYAQRNTFFVVMANRSAASRVRLEWTTDKAQGSKDFAIEPRSGMKAYYFNVSDCPEATGHLKSFSITPLDSKRGKWVIDQIRFEREEAIVEYAGKVESCTADSLNVRICGSIREEDVSAYSSICIYEYPLADEGAPVQSLELLCQCPVSASFEIADLPNSRLGGRMTHLSTRFLTVLKDSAGNIKPLDRPFYISNWMDFTSNPYRFELPDKDFSVLRYGAKGDGFTDDTRAIQKAIDACFKAGGGRVVLPGDDSPQGRRYVATNLHLKSNVEFHIEENAVLWQSYDIRDYSYVPSFGHDFDIPGCPWTHCLFVNMPLIQANGADHIKVTGPGVIRMADPWSSNPDWSHYASTCSDRIHICALAAENCSYIELTDFDQIRASNYHTSFYGDDHIFIGNMKMHEVRCVSGDGLSFAQGVNHVRIERIVFDSNDDAIVLCNSYRDPRGKNSPWRYDEDEADHSVRNLLVEHSYINSGKSGGGKAIAIIPWGSTNPDLCKQLLDSIEVYDCVLRGGHSVGTWCDNPFDGKPFNNAEQDDYAPVMNFRILGNDYQSACDILCVKPTNFVTDCGLHSSTSFINTDFSDGYAYWTCEGDSGAGAGFGYARAGGSLTQGLYLPAGQFVFEAEVRGTGTLEVKDALGGKRIARQGFCFESDEWTRLALVFRTASAADCLLGLGASEDAHIRACSIEICNEDIN
ncbi:MAG: hypothetical protein ACI399_00770 [Candidatus Cryptobacteroides sp.]